LICLTCEFVKRILNPLLQDLILNRDLQIAQWPRDEANFAAMLLVVIPSVCLQLKELKISENEFRFRQMQMTERIYVTVRSGIVVLTTPDNKISFTDSY
jgi:hypothetical protein